MTTKTALIEHIRDGISKEKDCNGIEKKGVWCKICEDRFPSNKTCIKCDSPFCYECCAYSENDGTRCSVCEGYKCDKHDYSKTCDKCGTKNVCGFCYRDEDCCKNNKDK